MNSHVSDFLTQFYPIPLGSFSFGAASLWVAAGTDGPPLHSSSPEPISLKNGPRFPLALPGGSRPLRLLLRLGRQGFASSLPRGDISSVYSRAGRLCLSSFRRSVWLP